MNFNSLIIDTETNGSGGFNKTHTQKCLEVGLLMGDGVSNEAFQYSTLLKNTISSEGDIVWKGHGINFEMCQGGKSVNKMFKVLIGCMRKVDENQGNIFCHNLIFDRQVINNLEPHLRNKELMVEFNDIIDRIGFCTCSNRQMLLKLTNYDKFLSLTNLHKVLLKTKPKQVHRAIDDCKILYRCVVEMKRINVI